ncbi:hypothetical protein D9758_018549 [Tetrapyrgos nigripes]|uniref:Uncharacterized protein n=1 Tax=Tetrapyrgos nigripes TaxID=182062 RepID=A0A8H5BYZ6_9AGAR|nr:hypothetical protein D9758_018549 [Tetrapyrgos nigripes]
MSFNPQFIFHDSPGFEKGSVKELENVQQFIEKRAKATDVEDQLHAVWFCLVTDAERPLLELEERFFKETHCGPVPVIAIFTKCDDLVTQLYDEEKEDDEIRQDAAANLEDKFRKPLAEYMQRDDGHHQQQVKELMEKTADSLGDPSLKLLFVCIQHNNLELCMRYAVKYTKIENFRLNEDPFLGLRWFHHAYYEGSEQRIWTNRVILGVLRISLGNYSQESFCDAWKMLTEDQQQAANLCSAIGRLARGGGHGNELQMNKWKQEFLNIILQHRLSHEHRL